MPPQPQQTPQKPQQAPQNSGAGAPAAKTIAGFDPIGFAKNLAMEASQVIPEGISDSDRKFVVEIIHKFCLLCGNALAKDDKFNLNADQASTITQLIGEWTFHKSIDLIRGGIPPELREGVLQKVAFTVFEIAKQAISKNLPQEKVIEVIEIQVRNAYKAAVEDLKSKGKINESTAKNAESQSNIDNMAQEQHEQEQQERLAEDFSDTKFLKLVFLALLIKKMPQEKAKEIISKFNQSEAQTLTQLMKIPRLEDKLDRGTAMKCLSEVKKLLPEPKTISKERIYHKLFKIVKSEDKNKISNIIDNERPIIRQFVMTPYTEDDVTVPVRVASVICKYLEEKLSSDDNKEEN